MFNLFDGFCINIAQKIVDVFQEKLEVPRKTLIISVLSLTKWFTVSSTIFFLFLWDSSNVVKQMIAVMLVMTGIFIFLSTLNLIKISLNESKLGDVPILILKRINVRFYYMIGMMSFLITSIQQLNTIISALQFFFIVLSEYLVCTISHPPLNRETRGIKLVQVKTNFK